MYAYAEPGARVCGVRLDVLVRSGRCVSSPVTAALPADVVAMCGTSHMAAADVPAVPVVVVLTRRGRLIWRQLPPSDAAGGPPLTASEALQQLEGAHGQTRAMERRLMTLGFELDRVSGALCVLRQLRASAVGWAVSVHPHTPERADLLLQLANRSPDLALPLLGWHLLVTLSFEYKPWLQLLVAPPTPLQHTHVLPLRDLAPSSSLPLPPIPLLHPSLLHRLRVRLTLHRPSSAHLRPDLRPGWNAAGPAGGFEHGLGVDLSGGFQTLDCLDLSTPPPLAHPQPPSFTVAGLRELEAELQATMPADSLPMAQAAALVRAVTQGLREGPVGEQGQQEADDGVQPFLTWTLPSYLSGWAEGEERCLASLLGPLSSTAREVMLSDDGRAMVVHGGDARTVLVRLVAGVTELGLEGPPQLTLSSGCQALLCLVQAACRRRLLRRREEEQGGASLAMMPRRPGSVAEQERRERVEAELLLLISELEAELGQQQREGSAAVAQGRRVWRLLERAAAWYVGWTRELGQGKEAQTMVMLQAGS